MDPVTNTIVRDGRQSVVNPFDAAALEVAPLHPRRSSAAQGEPSARMAHRGRGAYRTCASLPWHRGAERGHSPHTIGRRLCHGRPRHARGLVCATAAARRSRPAGCASRTAPAAGADDDWRGRRRCGRSRMRNAAETGTGNAGVDAHRVRQDGRGRRHRANRPRARGRARRPLRHQRRARSLEVSRRPRCSCAAAADERPGGRAGGAAHR